MARKHEHFGLSYLEELRMIKEREIICKESRRDFLKFKQAVAIAHTNVSSQPLLEDLTPDQSHQLEQYHLQRSESPHKPVININKTVPTEFIGSSEIARKVRISPEVRDMKKPINDLRMMMQTNTSVKEDSTYTNQKSYSEKITVENSSCSQESTNVKMPVIASLAGTTKKITMLKQPAPPRKPKYRKLTFHPRLVIYNPPILLQKVKDTRKMQGRAHSIKANVKNVETNKTKETSNDSKESDESSSTDSDSSEKASEKEKVIKKKDKKVYRELSKASQQDSVIEPEKAQSKRSRVSRSHPSVRSTSEQLEEARDITTPDTSKIYEENFQQSKPEELTSTPKLPVRVAARSIDEIIASLQSTFQSPSDQMIKELLESVLGQNYSIKMELTSAELKEKKTESQANEEIVTSFQEPSLTEESLSGTPGASLAFSEDMPDSVETEEYRLQLSSSDISLSQEPAFSVPKILEDIERKQESQITVKSPLEAVSSQLLQVRGEAILKAKPLEVQQKLSEKDLMLQQSLSSLSTWTPGFKGQHHSVIHHLCTASPNFALPADLQLASRVYHTFDRKGHYLLFTAEDLYHQEKASLCSEYIAFEEQMERNRICYEGVPVSELYQENQKDGINVLPPHTSGSLTEWQKIAEYYVEKPRLELLGEKVSVYPGTLKMFWAPAPPKFSAPLSFMKETLFPMYQSNVIEGVVVEDFSADLQDEDSESEDDLDIYSYMVSKSTLRRCKSSPDCDATEKLKISFIQRSVSAPDMSAFNSKTAFTISADFKTSMKELTVMKKQISDSEVEPEIEKSSSTKQLLIESCNAPQSVLVDTPMERTPVLDMQVDTDDDLALAEIARKSGTKYIIFPKRKTTKKSKKTIDRGKLEAVAEELKQPSKILKRFS